MMEYKGFIGKVEYDSDAKIFAGTVINTRTVITFQGESVSELEREFRASVDDYLQWCKEDGIAPEKPYSGRFNVRLQPSLHQQAVVTAKGLNISLNSFMEKAVMDEVARYNFA
ncbi:MAG: type II toxin-antitoxin system HicB family antitoxin [Spirochaetales bacterium]|nr:type II toxin-antitoxin system HicB family antitoxin [Spirochaetales bacterium]